VLKWLKIIGLTVLLIGAIFAVPVIFALISGAFTIFIAGGIAYLVVTDINKNKDDSG
jgi:hypothetical protein